MTEPIRVQRGRLVRETWVTWAKRQRRPKPGWLTGWDDLDEDQREVDMLIGEAVAEAERGRLSHREAVLASVKAELDDAFQFSGKDGVRHAYVTREWVQVLLAEYAASAAAAERESIIRLAADHAATASKCAAGTVPQPSRPCACRSASPAFPFADLLRERAPVADRDWKRELD